MNTVLKRQWKKTAVANFKVLLRHLSGWTEETLENLVRMVGVRDESGTGDLTEHEPGKLPPEPPFSIGSSTM
jgi:hypothetical protein